MAKAKRRRSLDETWQQLESKGEEMPRDSAGRPFVPAEMPNCDDEELGVSFFRAGVEGADYSSLTLPRTFFGRSELSDIDFRNTDLSGSRMCWNDFIRCDFSAADLSGCDMRASNFRECKFVRTVLKGADLRRSSFEDCDFKGADLTGAMAEDEDAIGCVQDHLTEEQQAVMTWQRDEGPEPPGG